MSISPIVTLGFGSFGGIRAIPTIGFNFSAAVVNEPVTAWASGGYFTRMSEEDFNKLRKRDRRPLETAMKRIRAMDADMIALHQALIEDKRVQKTAAEKLAKQQQLERITARRAKAEKDAVKMAVKLFERLEKREAAKQEEEDELLIINHLLH